MCIRDRNLHNESFMTRFGFINQLSFRVSYGFVGSIDRNALPFSVLRKVSNYSYNGEKIMDRYDPSNPSIKWQRQENRNIGFDASMLNNRINIVVNYYNNDTRNLLDEKKIAASTGPVSYTHLDVYKRQTSRNISEFLDAYNSSSGKSSIVIENMNCKSFSEACTWKSRMKDILAKYTGKSLPKTIILLGQERCV